MTTKKTVSLSEQSRKEEAQKDPRKYYILPLGNSGYKLMNKSEVKNYVKNNIKNGVGYTYVLLEATGILKKPEEELDLPSIEI